MEEKYKDLCVLTCEIKSDVNYHTLIFFVLALSTPSPEGQSTFADFEMKEAIATHHLV